MQIFLNQTDIEAAITQYIVDMGITHPVENIDFGLPRKGEDKVNAEIELVGIKRSAKPDNVAELPKAVEATPEQETTGEPVEESAEPEKSAKKSKQLFGNLS